MPPDVKTVAVLPFDNLTPEPTLTQEVSDSVRTAVQRRLGLRQAGENSADAIVSGSITRYEPDVPVGYVGTTSGTGAGQSTDVTVTRRLVQIMVSVDILARDGRTIWQRKSMMLEGDYDPEKNETEADARGRALSKLVTNIVDGAQSQW